MSISLRTILLVTDGSPGAEAALRAAADLSRKTGARLHLGYVLTDVPTPAYSGLALDDYSRQLQEAKELLRWQACQARAAGGRGAWTHLREGELAEEIVGLAEVLDADLVVIGKRRLGWMKRLISGSVSEDVVRRSSCPVLVVRGGEGAWPVERVVVGDDGSWAAQRAGELAAEIADLFGAEVMLVRAYENPPKPVGGWSAEDRRKVDEARLRNLQELEGQADRLDMIAHDRPETRLAEAEATSAIVSVAEENAVDGTLLAVGSRGLGAPMRVLSGSVSTKVLRTANGSVLVVPPNASPADDREMRSRGKASDFGANEEGA